MDEHSVIIVANPLIPLQEKQERTWKYKLKRFRQEPPWSSIFMCSGCLAILLTVIIMLIFNEKEFSVN